MTGNAASKAALDILRDKHDVLKGRYPADYLEKAEIELNGSLSEGEKTVEVLKKLKERQSGDPIMAVVPCGRQGVYEALWRLGEETDSGLKAELFSISILQCAIEFCDFLDINPYEADSTGCTLIAAVSPQKMIKELEDAGISANIIGHSTEENARVTVGNTIRYLTGQTKNEQNRSKEY